MSSCSKPGCSNPGSVLLGYDYAARTAVLEDVEGLDLSPHLYVLCSRCADNLTPPRGWILDDRRHAAEPALWAGTP